jgi:hypothetical protein
MNVHLLGTLALLLAPAEIPSPGSRELGFTSAEIDLTEIDRLIVPHDAAIVRVAERGKLSIHIRRRVATFSPVSVKNARDFMGCAERRDGRTLTLATFGGWSSKEGEASIQVRLLVPEEIEIVGERVQIGHAVEGWTRVAEAPDPEWKRHWPDDADPITDEPGDYPVPSHVDAFIE